MQPPPRKSSKGIWLGVVLLSVLLVFSVMVNVALMISLMVNVGPGPSTTGAADEYPSFEEEWSYGKGEAKVVRIPVHGVIMREAGGGLFQPRHDKIESILRQIRAATHDPEVRALIVEVDSPGGAVTPSDEIYNALMRFKKHTEGRKIVVHMRDLAASGGYYVAMAGDWIVAEPTGLVGSIGVIMQALNWKDLTEKIGLRATTITSGNNKDLMNPFEEVSPEHVALLQKMIDSMFERFFGIVQQGRPAIDPETLRTLADGRIFTADEAMEHKLIDEVGYWDEAVARTAELLNEPDVRIVRYQHSLSFFERLAEVRTPSPLNAWQEAGIPRIMYLWNP